MYNFCLERALPGRAYVVSYVTNLLVYVFNIKHTIHGISDVVGAAAVFKHGSFRDGWIVYAINDAGQVFLVLDFPGYKTNLSNTFIV